jgi:hypothetical protein
MSVVALAQVFPRSEVLVMNNTTPAPGTGLTEEPRLPEQFDRLEQQRAERFRVIDEMRAALKGVQAEEIEREAARALAAVRAERGQASASQ